MQAERFALCVMDFTVASVGVTARAHSPVLHGRVSETEFETMFDASARRIFVRRFVMQIGNFSVVGETSNVPGICNGRYDYVNKRRTPFL